MSMDNTYPTKNVTGGNSSADATNINDVLESLDSGSIVLFAQGFYKLTANLTLPAGVTLIIEDDVTIDGGGFQLDVPEGRLSIAADVSAFTLEDITLSGGFANGALVAIAPSDSPLQFNATGVTLMPGNGAAALSFERPVTGDRDIALTPSGAGDKISQEGSALDLGSGFDTTILPKIYQEQQGEIALTKGLVSIRSELSFQSATITIDEPREGDILSFVQDAETLAALLRVTLDFNAETGVLSITPAEGRLLNAGLVELLLEAVRFENTTSEPGLSRTFTYELTDSAGNILTSTATLLINDLNAPPELELNKIDDSWSPGDATATFVQGGGAVDITTDAAITLTDPEDDVIKFVTVRITDVIDKDTETLKLRNTPKDGDLFGLLTPALLAQITGVTVSYDRESATLTLEASQSLLDDGIATTDLFEFLLNEVKYANTSANPAAGGNTTRTIEVVAKDTNNNNPMMSEALSFTIAIEADNLDPINAAADAAEMRDAIGDTPELAELLDDAKFTALSSSRQDALLLDLVDNKPSADGYTAFAQFEDDFFNPLRDAYDAIRLAVATPSVASIQAALDALPVDLTLSGEPGLDKAALQAQLNTFDTLTVLKQPILDAAAAVSGVDSLVGLVAAAIDQAPDVVVAQVNGATTVAEIQDILADVFVYASGGPVDGYDALEGASQDFAALALLQGRGNDGYDDFGMLESAFTAAVALGAAGEDFVDAANTGNVSGLITAAEAASAALDGITIGSFNKSDLDAAITVFKELAPGRQTAVANDLLASGGGDWSLADLYSSNLLALTGALVEFRVATAAAVEQASNGVLTLQALQDVADALANIADKNSDAQVNGTNIADLAQGAAAELERLTDLSPNRLSAVLEDVSEGTFISFAQLSAQLDTDLTLRKSVQDVVEALVEKAREELDGLVVADFQAVQTALQTIVDEERRETLTDGTSVEDISADALSAAIAQFGTLSQPTQDATLAAVQKGEGYTTLGSVLDAFEPAIKGVLLEALNAAVTVQDVDAVLTDAGKIFPQVAEVALDDASFVAVKEFFLLGVQGDGFDDFDTAAAFFFDAIAFAEAGEALVAAANVGDANAVAAQLTIGRDKLDAMGIVLGDVTVEVLDTVLAAIDGLVPGRFQAAIDDLADNGPQPGWTVANLYDGSLTSLAEGLILFRVEVQDAVVAAGDATAGSFDATSLDGVVDALQVVQGKKNDATISNQPVGDAVAAVSGVADDLKSLAAGRVAALNADLAANANTEDGFSSFAAMFQVLEPLVAFRTDVQTAVEAGKAGTLGVSELAEVRDSLAALDGKKVNGETVVAGDVNAGFDALIGRVNALEPGRLIALQNDLGANGDNFASFTAMIGLFDGLLSFREAVQDAVVSGGNGTLALDDIEAITTALEALPAGTKVNDTDVAAVIAGQKELEALLGDDQLVAGRFAALAADLGANAGDGFGSYTAMVTLLQPLAEFRIELGAAVDAAAGGDFTRGGEGTLEGVLAKLEAIAAVKAEATINGADIGGIITEKQALIDRVTALSNDPEPRFDAFVEDLKGSYSSFTALITRLDTVLELRDNVQVAVNAVIGAADGSVEAALTLELFEEVRDALQAIEVADLTTSINGVSVEATDSVSLSGALTTFAELRETTQEAVLAEVQSGSFTTLGGVLDAFPAALNTVGLGLVNGAENATELLDALADIAVYVTDNAALNAVLALRDTDSARAEALAADFLLNSGGNLTSLAEAGELLAVLEDVYSGLDVNFDAGLFTLGLNGDPSFTLDVGGDSVELANIGSITFADKSAHVAGAGAFQTVTQAIDAAGTGGDVVLLAAGEYSETINVNKTGLTILGPNAGISGHAGVRGDEAKFTASGSNATFRVTAEDVTIDGVQLALVPTGNTPQIDVSGDGASFLNNIINAAVYQKASGLTFEGNFVGDFGDALGKGYSGNAIVQDSNNVVRSDWVIRDNVFDGTDRGIVLASSGSVGSTYENILIENNVFQNIAGRGVQFGDNASINGVTITANIFKDGSAGIGVFNPVSPIDGLVINGNTFDALQIGVLINAPAAADLFVDQFSNTFTDVAQAVRFQAPIPELDVAAVFGAVAVDFDSVDLTFFDGSYEISLGDAVVTVVGIAKLEFTDQNVLVVGDGGFETIQDAVDAAVQGDTIIVLGDETYGPVTLDKGVTLLSSEGATITGAGINQGAAVRVADGVEGVTIEGFKIEAGVGDLAALYLVGNNTNIDVDGNTISGGAAHAVLAGGGMNDVTLTGNVLSGSGSAAVVYVNGVASVNNASTGVSLINNTITGGANAGLLVGLESTGGVVQGNAFEGSASYAALELFGAGVTVGGSEEGQPNTFAAFPRVIIDANGNYQFADLLANNDFVEPEIVLIRNAATGDIYNSLAEALGDAQSGQTVQISAGVLDLSSEDRLTVPEGVTLTGAGLDNGAPLTTLKGGLLELADGANVEGLAFTDYDARLGGGQEVVLVSGDGATVKDSTFTVDGASSAYAFEIRVTGEDATITGNIISRDAAGDTAGSSIGNSGISASGVGKITITGNTLERAIIGVVTAAEGVDLTITDNTITPTVVSNDGIFVTGPGFGNIPDGSQVDIGSNLYTVNGNDNLLGLQLRGTATEGFDFTGFATNGQDFFQGGTGNDTFALQGTGNLLDGGAGGIDTLVLDGLIVPSDLTKGSNGDVLLDGNILRNIERLELPETGVVSLVPADGFSILLPGDENRPDIRAADGNLLEAGLLVAVDQDVPNALTLEGGDYTGSVFAVFFGDFALTIDGDSELPIIATDQVLSLTGSGNVSMVAFEGFLDASELTGSLTTPVSAASAIIGGSNVDVITVSEFADADPEDADNLDLVVTPVAFDRALLREDEIEDDSVLVYALDPEDADANIFLSAVETLVFEGVTVHVAGVGTGRSVQDAVDAAGAGDIVFIGNGLYDEVVTIPSDKAGLTIIGSDDVTVTAFDVMADGVTIDNLSVVGGGSIKGQTAGVYVAASNVELSNLTLTGPEQGENGGAARGILTEGGKGDGLKVTNVTASDWATGIYLNPGATGAEVTGSDLSGNFVGMSIDGEDGVTLTGNTFGGTLEDLGLGAAGIASATGNTFVSGQFGNFTGQVVTLGANTVGAAAKDAVILGTPGNDVIAASPSNDAIFGQGGIDTVTFTGNLADYTLSISAGVITVDGPDGTNTLTGIEAIRFDDGFAVLEGMSIQTAINLAESGDTINVLSGEFDENLTVNKAVTLLGANADKDGTDGGRGAESVLTGTVTVLDGATINGFGFTDDGAFGTRMLVNTDKAVTVSNSVFTGKTGGGNNNAKAIEVAAGAGAVSIAGNLFTGPADAGQFSTAAWQSGIFSNPGGTRAFLDNTFEKTRTAINVDGFDDNTTIADNVIRDSGSGITLQNSGAVTVTTVTGNLFTDVGTDFNLGNIAGGVTFDASATDNAATDTLRVLGSNAADTLTASTGNDVLVGQGGDDTFILAGTSGTIDVRGGGGINTVVAPDEDAFGLTLNSITSDNGTITLAFEDGEDTASVTALLQGVQRFQARIDTLLKEFGSVGVDGVLTLAFEADSDFPVKLQGSGDRPDIFFDAADLPGVMALAAQQLEGEAVKIVLSDQATYPGVIDLTDLDSGFNATSITVERDGSDAVFIGPVFAPVSTVTLGDGVKFANVAPQLANGDAFVAAAVDESVTGDPYDPVTVAQLNTLFRDDDVGSTLDGIALIGIEESDREEGIIAGRWQFKTTGDGAFRDLLAVLESENLVLSETTAMLLANTTQLRFVPDAATDGVRNFGRIPELSFVAVDSTQRPIDGGQFTTSARLRTDKVEDRGGDTAYSLAVATFTQDVTELLAPEDFSVTDNILASLTEDVFTAADGSFTDNGGDTVADIFGLSFGDDEEKTDLKGVVVVANASVASQGAWQYRSNGDWVDVGAVSDSSALFLAPDAELRFLPNWNFSGEAPELSVRGVADATELTPGGTVDASGGGGLGTNFSASVATLGVEIDAVADTYTFGRDGLTATFEFVGNPGSVFEYNELPVISLLNFDRQSEQRDLIEFDFAGLTGTPVFVNGLNNQQNSAANVILFNAGTIVTAENVGDAFFSANFATGKTSSQLFPNGFFGEPGEIGEGLGIFQQSDGSVAVWFASELNAANSDIDYVKLGYFAGESWSLAYQNDPEENEVPTVTLAELQQFVASDFAFL